MAIVINGSGTITGISAGGLPDGSVDSDTLATGIDATKLADGTVTSTELQYINTLASNAQTQISAAGSDVVDDTTPQLGGNLEMNDFGLSFPATQASSAGANVLDDYEEGGWSPQLTDGVNTTVQPTTIGRYTKVGNMVYYYCYVETNSIGSITGQIYINNLPYTSYTTSNHYQPSHCGYAATMALGTAGYNMSGWVEPNNTRITLKTWDVTTGNSGMQATEWSNGGNSQAQYAGSYIAST